MADVADLAAVGTNYRLDAFGPTPSGLQVELPDRVTLQPDYLQSRLVGGADLVGLVMRFSLELFDFSFLQPR